ncbi:FabD/lysophospholipase-like protein [Byssothecium circinans]|uniref:FabD/lysophospholipase-like protein n=1 Tax=Byssothecium circinans TaxID=147558 RepID=A0A6A5TMF4_9PLEO|nr:FabD/lysophospholipase-like protein [Byssothecium circinans]
MLQPVISTINHGTYLTGPLEKAFKEVFPPDYVLFGGNKNSEGVSVKAAVTTTTRQSRVVVLSNYNRKSPKIPLNHFHRPGPEKEMMLWEAARATSAAPSYFRPFAHTASEQVYLDGGIYHNSPILVADVESKAIWPSSRDRQPDIILSVGTGIDPRKETAVDTSVAVEALVSSVGSDLPIDRDRRSYLEVLMRLGYDHLINGLDSERAWNEWLQIKAPDPRNERRYRRLNVRFKGPVRMDKFDDIKKCRDAVTEQIDDTEILKIADQLISSCFYFHFEQEEIRELRNGGYDCTGRISCRLFGDSLQKLGAHLEKLSGPPKPGHFRPSFVIREIRPNRKRTRKLLEIKPDWPKTMRGEKKFAMDVPLVLISSERAETEILLKLRPDQEDKDLFPISGFPRRLQDDHKVILQERWGSQLIPHKLATKLNRSTTLSRVLTGGIRERDDSN